MGGFWQRKKAYVRGTRTSFTVWLTELGETYFTGVAMLSEERRRYLLGLLTQQGSLGTAAVAEQLGVSEMTIRRDLTDLERRGLARRIHGGAQRVYKASYTSRPRRAPGTEQQIGVAAAQLVCTHETIYLDAGDLALELARALKRRDLKLNILTHAVSVAAELAGHPGFTVIQVGGELYPETLAATGPTALATISQFSFDRLFLTAQGLHPRAGVTHGNLLEVAVKAAALSRAAWTALLLGSGRWNRQAMTRVTDPGKLDMVISDTSLPAEARHFLRSIDVGVSPALPDAASKPNPADEQVAEQV